MSETTFSLSAKLNGDGVALNSDGALNEYIAIAVLFWWANLAEKALGQDWTISALEQVAADLENGTPTLPDSMEVFPRG